jgi:hypothetical protein
MIRERTHFTVNAAGMVSGTVWTQVAGLVQRDRDRGGLLQLAAYEHENEAFMADPELLKLFPRFDELTVPDRGFNELSMKAERAGA